MLRNPSSKISLSMNEVDQLQHRLRLQRTAKPFHPITLGHVVHGNSPVLRTGAQRSRDDYVVQGGSAQHTPNSATVESGIDSNGGSEGLCLDTRLTARIVEVVEISPVITEVCSYDPPAAFAESPKLSGDQRSSCPPQQIIANDGGSAVQPAIFDSMQQEDLGCSQITRSSQPTPRAPYLTGSRLAHTTMGSNFPPTAHLDPHAATFVPRVRLGSSIVRARPAIDRKHHFEQECLDFRSTSPSMSPSRGHVGNFSRPLPRPNRKPRYARQPSRNSNHISNTSSQLSISHATLLAIDSLSMVPGRYPVFPSSVASRMQRDDQLPPSPQETTSLGRFESCNSQIFNPHQLYQRPWAVSQEARQSRPIRPRASSTSRSIPNLVPHQQRPVLHSRRSSLNWTKNQAHTVNSPTFLPDPSGASSSSYSGCYGSTTTAAEPPHGSPLDDLTVEFQLWSTRLSTRTAPTLSALPRPASPAIRLLSGNPFESHGEDEYSMLQSNLDLCSNAIPVGYRDSTNSRVSIQTPDKSHHGGMVQIRRPESRDGLQPSSPRNRSSLASSGSYVDKTVCFPNDSPCEFAHRQVGVTRSSWTSATTSTPSSIKPIAPTRATPRLRVNDDTQPPNTQPRTLPEISRRHSLANPESLPFNPHRQAHSVTSTIHNNCSNFDPSWSYYGNVHAFQSHFHLKSQDQQNQDEFLGTSISSPRVTAARPWIPHLNPEDQENNSDPSNTGRDDAWVRRRTTGREHILFDSTPPRKNESERYRNS